jgi:hypothetical protein
MKPRGRAEAHRLVHPTGHGARRAAVKAAALELQPVERLQRSEPDHCVGELNLATGAAGSGRRECRKSRCTI